MHMGPPGAPGGVRSLVSPAAAPTTYRLTHGPDGRVIALRAVYPMVDTAAPVAWIHAAKCGEYKGHPAGEFEITPKVLAQCVKNFEAQSNPIPLDYEHQSVGFGEAPAAGWVQEVRASGSDLYARVEFTARAAERIRAGEYRYCSIVLMTETIDRESGDDIGASLHSIALTNTPFIDGLAPIELPPA